MNEHSIAQTQRQLGHELINNPTPETYGAFVAHVLMSPDIHGMKKGRLSWAHDFARRCGILTTA